MMDRICALRREKMVPPAAVSAGIRKTDPVCYAGSQQHASGAVRTSGMIHAFLTAALIMILLVLLQPAYTYAQGSVWDGKTADTSWYEGHESDTVFSISEPAQLAGLAAIVNGTADGIKKDDFSGRTIKLTSDMDLGSHEWTGIGIAASTEKGDFLSAESAAFNGTFDGNGRTIKNLKIENSESTRGAALFGYTGADSVLSDFTVSGSVKGVYHTAGVAAVAGGKLTGITNNADISATESILGGIVAEGSGDDLEIRKCRNTGSITNSSREQSTGRLGGMVGTVDTGSSGIISECSNTGTIKGYQYIGGIIGGQYGDVDVSDCYNKGDLTGISFGKVYLGGISGKCENGTIENCYNRGNLHDEHWAQGHLRAFGGITGCEEGRSAGTTAIVSCYNTGRMTADTSNMVQGKNFIYMSGNISGGNESTDANTMNYENCFYLKGVMEFAEVSSDSYKLWCDVFRENPKAYDTESITGKTSGEMKDDEFPAELGSAYYADNDGINDGYPVLYWEVGKSKAEQSYDIKTAVYGDSAASISVISSEKSGETVTLSVDNITSGRQVYKVIVKEKSGKTTECEKSGSTFSFTMPKRTVTVVAYIENKVDAGAAEHEVKLTAGLDAIWSADIESGYSSGDDKVKTGATVLVTMKKNRSAVATSLDGISVTGVDPSEISEYSLSKDGNDKGVTGIYAFTMPDKDVEITPEASYEEFTVYRQVGEDGVPKPVKTYSREDMMKLADDDTLYVSGYSSDTEAFITKSEKAVTLKTILSDTGLSDYSTSGTAYKVSAIDGMSQTYKYDELYGSSRYYYPGIFSGSAEGRTAVDAMFTIRSYMCPQSEGDVEDKVCDNLYAYRFVFGQTEEEFNNGKPLVKNKVDQYMPKCVSSLTVITDDEDVVPGDEPWDGTVDVRWYNGHEDDTSYEISTPAELAGLAAIVNGKLDKDTKADMKNKVLGEFKETTSSDPDVDDYWVSVDDMNGKTVTLTSDLDMGGRYDRTTKKWSGPNYTPIGGEWCTDTADENTCLSTSFKGTFDGNGHTVKNIYCDRYFENKDGIEEAYKMSQSVGLIGRLGSHDKDKASTLADSPAVKNVTVKGYFKARRSIGGIVGKIGKTNKGGIIENCANFASITGTDAKGTGGIVGSSWNKGLVKNCYNAGTVKNIGTAKGFPTGGISGSNEVRIVNCYNIGKITAEFDSYEMSLGTNNAASGYFENCYWLKGTAKGGGVYSTTAKDSVYTRKATAMQKVAFLKELNGSSNAYTADDEESPINNGYPVLKSQVGKTPSFTDLKIEGSPETTTYIEGQEFDTTGINVWAEYSDGSRDRIEDLTVTPENFSASPGSVEVTVSCRFGGRTVSEKYTVNVVSRKLKGVEIAKAPDRTVYTAGEDFDTSGMTVRAVFSGSGADDMKEIITAKNSSADGYEIVGAKDLKYGTDKVTVSYTYGGLTYTADQDITVVRTEPEMTGDIYRLKSAEDMIWFSALVNERGMGDVKAELADDITLTGQWTPVGRQGSSFTGVFDGKGHSIEGLRIVGDEKDTYLALFGDAENARIRDLTVSGSITGGYGTAGIAASVRGGTVISGCTSNVTVKAYEDYAGGIAAENLDDCIIENCRNNGNIYGSSYAGGITGRNTGTVKNSVNTAAVSGESSCGGLVGEQNGSSYALLNSGDVSCRNGNAGALFGLMNTATSNKALYFEKKTADKAAGRIEDGSVQLVSDWAKAQLGEDFSTDTLGAAFTMDRIKDIGTVTAGSKAVISTARSEYDLLSDAEKKYVMNYKELTAAETKLEDILNTPAAVKGVKASSASYNSIKISWSKTSGAKGYKVYRATSKNGSYRLVKTTSSLYFTNTSLKTGTIYYYKVRAYRSFSGRTLTGGYSSVVSSKPVPKTPSVSLSAGSKKITVKWSKVTGAGGYQIYRSTKKSSGYKKIKTITKGSTKSYVNRNLKKGRTYYYKIRAYRKAGSKYVYSSYSSVKYKKAK